jgi:hypothetical protein
MSSRDYSMRHPSRAMKNEPDEMLIIVIWFDFEYGKRNSHKKHKGHKEFLFVFFVPFVAKKKEVV